AGHSWTEITDGLPSEFGFAAAAHPHDRDTFYVIPLDPGHARCMPDGEAAVWRTRDAGSSWERLTQGLPQGDAHLGALRAATATTRPRCTSGRRRDRSSRRSTRATAGHSSPTTCRQSGRSRWHRSTDVRAETPTDADAALQRPAAPRRGRGGDGRAGDRRAR